MDNGHPDRPAFARPDADSDAVARGTLPRPDPDPVPDAPTEPPSPAPTDPAQPVATLGRAATRATDEVSRLRRRGRNQSRLLSETLRRLDDLQRQISRHQQAVRSTPYA
jgi:hypothetical protein